MRFFTAVNIGKFVLRAGQPSDLVDLGTVSPRDAAFLEAAVRAGVNVLVWGGNPAAGAGPHEPGDDAPRAARTAHGRAMSDVAGMLLPLYVELGSRHLMGSGERGEAVTTASGGRRPRREAPFGVESEVATRELLTPVELADRWGVTTGHLANLRHQGEGIGYLKIGSRVAYRLSDVLAYEDSVFIPARESATRAGV